MRMKKTWVWLQVVAALFMLAGCGGGSSSSGSSTPSVPVTTASVSGVAAAGSALVGKVYLKDSSSPSKELVTDIAADGSFKFDVTNLTKPFLLKAVGASGGKNYTLYSFIIDAGVANINPLSNLALVRANGNDSLDALYNSMTTALSAPLISRMPIAINEIQSLLKQILAMYGVLSTYNFVSDSFAANHQGLDLLFDNVSFTANSGNIVISNKASAAVIYTAMSNNMLSGQINITNVPSPSTAISVAVAIVPSAVSVSASGSYTFQALVTGSANQSVAWKVVETGGGSITTTGVYTAPSAAGTYHVTASSSADPTKSATASVIVTTTTPTAGTQIWKTDSTVIPSVTITIGSYIGKNDGTDYYSGSIQSAAYKNSLVSFSKYDVSNYIQVYYLTLPTSNIMLINGDDGNGNIIGIFPSENLLTTKQTTVNTFIGFMGSYNLAKNATLIKQ